MQIGVGIMARDGVGSSDARALAFHLAGAVAFNLIASLIRIAVAGGDGPPLGAIREEEVRGHDLVDAVIGSLVPRAEAREGERPRVVREAALVLVARPSHQVLSGDQVACNVCRHAVDV